jgi:hypothetical protein
VSKKCNLAEAIPKAVPIFQISNTKKANYNLKKSKTKPKKYQC